MFLYFFVFPFRILVPVHAAPASGGGAVGAAHILHNITGAAWERNVTDGLAAASRRV